MSGAPKTLAEKEAAAKAQAQTFFDAFPDDGRGPVNIKFGDGTVLAVHRDGRVEAVRVTP